MNLSRFESIAIEKLVGERYSLTWVKPDGLVVTKLLSFHRPYTDEELQYETDRRAKELIKDIASEEGWFDQYKLAGYPLPENYPELSIA